MTTKRKAAQVAKDEKRYRVDIGHLVGFDLGQVVTGEEIVAAGGNVDHLLSLGAVSVERKGAS